MLWPRAFLARGQVLISCVPSQVVRPLKSFLQAVQRNQLLASPGPSGQGGGIKSFIRRNTPTRPNVKVRAPLPSQGWGGGACLGGQEEVLASRSVNTSDPLLIRVSCPCSSTAASPGEAHCGVLLWVTCPHTSTEGL